MEVKEIAIGKLKGAMAEGYIPKDDDNKEPEKIPKGTDYASIIESNVPVVVQHTRLDSGKSENALLTTLAYAD